ncbi:MAG: hypothetical protein OEZ19_10295 [Paracoccaceae bacterium]|nr:hypothetical protein [Paracoccaceae bacterium]
MSRPPARLLQRCRHRRAIAKTLSYSNVISNVDIEQISWTDFVAIYAMQLDRGPSLTKEERAAARKRMKDTWNYLKGPDGTDLAVTATMTIFEEIEAKYRSALVFEN